MVFGPVSGRIPEPISSFLAPSISARMTLEMRGLGHESMETTQIYLYAGLRLKEDALKKAPPLDVKPGRFRPDDELLGLRKPFTPARRQSHRIASPSYRLFRKKSLSLDPSHAGVSEVGTPQLSPKPPCDTDPGARQTAQKADEKCPLLPV